MSDGMIAGVFAGFIVAMLIWIGWGAAHNIIADECEKIGAFYVGATVYECRVKS